MKTSSREEAARMFVAGRRRYWNQDKKFTVWTMLDASDTPVAIEA